MSEHELSSAGCWERHSMPEYSVVVACGTILLRPSIVAPSACACPSMHNQLKSVVFAPRVCNRLVARRPAGSDSNCSLHRAT
jgi:hypothetical protein